MCRNHPAMNRGEGSRPRREQDKTWPGRKAKGMSVRLEVDLRGWHLRTQHVARG